MDSDRFRVNDVFLELYESDAIGPFESSLNFGIEDDGYVRIEGSANGLRLLAAALIALADDETEDQICLGPKGGRGGAYFESDDSLGLSIVRRGEATREQAGPWRVELTLE